MSVPFHQQAQQVGRQQQSQTSSLASSLASLRTSTALLSSSLAILHTGTSDLPRLTKVLSQTRHFELVPTSALQTAQEAVLAELTPEVERLLERVESVVERRERRVEWLRARWALGEGRLGRDTGINSAVASTTNSAYAPSLTNSSKPSSHPRTNASSSEVAEERAPRPPTEKKERLSYAVERLTLQANQRERQLRKSMAAQEVRHEEEEEEL